ncbi:hypothetical protein COLSTE_02562, partial [Collinsella stercoris DSM 13279]
MVAANDDAAVRGGMPRIRSPRPLPAEGRGAGPTLYRPAPFCRQGRKGANHDREQEGGGAR